MSILIYPGQLVGKVSPRGILVQTLIYTVLGAIAAVAAYAVGTPIYKSSRDELKSRPGNEEEPAVKLKERLNASIGD